MLFMIGCDVASADSDTSGFPTKKCSNSFGKLQLHNLQ